MPVLSQAGKLPGAMMNLTLTVIVVSILFLMWCGIFLYLVSQMGNVIQEERKRKADEWKRKRNM